MLSECGVVDIPRGGVRCNQEPFVLQLRDSQGESVANGLFLLGCLLSTCQ